MDLNDKLKDLTEEELAQLSEESEANEDDFEDTSSEEVDPNETKLDDSNDDEGSQIEEDVEEIEETTADAEFEAIDDKLKWLTKLYAITSNYNAGDLTTALANILQMTHTSYNTAVNYAKDINHTKGRYRSSSGDVQAALMFDGSYDDSSDEYDIMVVNKLVINMLQQYIDDHDIDKLGEDLSDEQKKSNLDSIKVVLILMVSCNKYDIFPSLNLPKYAQKWIIDTMQIISDTQESVFNDWIDYLNRTKNKAIADKCLEIGYQFFKVSKAIDTFNRYFTREEIANIKKYDEVYAKFLECRDKYNKLSNGVNYKTLYPIFDITDDAFSKRKKKVLSEFMNKYSNVAEDPEKAMDALKQIFLEQSTNE